MVMKKYIDRTFLRSEETMDRYIAHAAERAKIENPPNPFENIEEMAIKSFNHWVIVPNEFPYDAIATTSHLLFTKRTVPFDWTLLNTDELEELESLRKTYLNEHYDLIWENLPKGQTVPGHFHLHVLILKREKVEYEN
jgi:hypothetical protein